MATVLDALSESLTPQLADQWANLLHLDSAAVKEGVNKAAPVLLAAVGKQTATTEGADEVLGSLKQDEGSALDTVTQGSGYDVLRQWLGVGTDKVASWFKDTTGVDIAPFLPLAAPLLLRALESVVKDKSLDGAGLAEYVKSENDAFAKANPQLASEINASLDAGANVNERAAEQRARFEENEWNTLTNVPALASFAVMASAWSGPRGVTKEVNALLDAVMDTSKHADADTLVGLISRNVTNPETVDELGVTRDNASEIARDACLDAVAILNDKATHNEIVAYKEFVMKAATQVASATNDGGVFGFGGKPISAEEQRTLDLIAAALAYEPEKE